MCFKAVASLRLEEEGVGGGRNLITLIFLLQKCHQLLTETSAGLLIHKSLRAFPELFTV